MPAYTKVEEEETSWLPLITLILLVVAIVGLLAAVIACLMQRMRQKALIQIYDTNTTTKLPDDSEKT